jgi:hypothetical protein
MGGTMSDTSWEDRFRSQEPNAEDVFSQPLQPDERHVALELMGHMRHLASYWQPPTETTDALLTKESGPYGDWPEDTRPISPSHSIGWMTIKQCGDYWEVLYGSIEFSSSFSAMARGRTLAEALYNVNQEG